MLSVESTDDAQRTAEKRAYQRAYYLATKENKKVYEQANADRRRADKRARYAKNREAGLLKKRKRILTETDRARRQAWRKANPDKVRARSKTWAAAHPAARTALAAARRAGLKTATPSWVDRAEIRKIYQRAAALGLQVDHIHPLKGRNFSGLHVPWNLQLLAATDNISKGNKLLPEHAS